MRRFNKNIIVFIICGLFVVSGFTIKCMKKIAAETKPLLTDSTNIGEYTANVEQILSERIRYHDLLMDINSISKNLEGNRIVEKEDSIIVRTESGKLAVPVQEPDEKAIKENIEERIEKYKFIAEESGIGFLTVSVPPKGMFELFPENIIDYSHDEYKLNNQILKEKSIPVLDLQEMIYKENLDTEDLFFITDHHWTPYTGFFVNKYICKDLNERYGFIYDSRYTDINNFNVKTYQNQFLGSYGKKVGTYFTWSGAEDFDIITPKFETSFTEEQPFKNEIRNGKFEDTLLFLDNMKKDYYHIGTYSTYSGGDFRLQIMRNHMNNEGAKIVMIRNSFACVVAPFLAFQASELHIMDVRDGDYYVGDIIDIKEYVKQINADYIIVIN